MSFYNAFQAKSSELAGIISLVSRKHLFIVDISITILRLISQGLFQLELIKLTNTKLKTIVKL